MNISEKLKELLEADPNFKVFQLEIAGTGKDPTHVERRMQQRAICNEAIVVALLYGHKKIIHGAMTYTILDRKLKNTPYYRYITELRGLRVIQSCEGIITVLWYEPYRKGKTSRLTAA